jgi:twinkle protein
MINQDSINELKQFAKMSEILALFSSVKRSGSEYEAKCPIHNEKTASFKVPSNNDVFGKCFGCGFSGDVFDLVIKMNNCTFYEAVEFVANHYNYELEQDDKKIIIPQARLEKIEPKLIKWFEDRGITNNTLLRFKITQSIEWMPKAKCETPVLCFNYYRNDELVNIKYRGAQKDFRLNKSSELIFYNIDSIKDEETCVIVEGEIDALSMYEAGIYNVVSVPNGTTPKGNMRLQYLDNCYEYFVNMRKIIIATDNDNVGKALKEELSRRLGKDRCFEIQYPQDCKDANDVLKLHGKETLASLIECARELPIDGIVNHDDLANDVLNYYENGYPQGTKTGIEGFDEYLQLMPGQFTTVTGVPGHGKSEWVDNMIAHTAVKSGWKWAVCSFENTPAALHATKLVEKLSGKAFDFRKDPLNRVSSGDIEMLLTFIGSNFAFINTGNTDITLEGILAKTSELVARKGINGLLIDPWNYIEHKIPVGMPETLYISDSLTKIKQAAIKLGIHIIIVAHPAKLQKPLGQKKYEVPTMYSILGSAHFNNKTDNGLTVYRDFETGNVQIHIQKVRYSWLGKIGCVEYFYNTYTRQYEYINN